MTIGGKPLPADALARIFFVPARSGPTRNAPPSIAKVVDSSYVAENVPAGSVNVTFEIQQFTNRQSERGIKEFVNLVPAAFQNGTTIDVTKEALEILSFSAYYFVSLW